MNKNRLHTAAVVAATTLALVSGPGLFKNRMPLAHASPDEASHPESGTKKTVKKGESVKSGDGLVIVGYHGAGKGQASISISVDPRGSDAVFAEIHVPVGTPRKIGPYKDEVYTITVLPGADEKHAEIEIIQRWKYSQAERAKPVVK